MRNRRAAIAQSFGEVDTVIACVADKQRGHTRGGLKAIYLANEFEDKRPRRMFIDSAAAPISPMRFCS